MIHLRSVSLDAPASDGFPFDVPAIRAMREIDFETPITEAETLAETWPHARLLRTSGLGHRRILRDPHVVEQVVEFLAAKA